MVLEDDAWIVQTEPGISISTPMDRKGKKPPKVFEIQDYQVRDRGGFGFFFGIIMDKDDM